MEGIQQDQRVGQAANAWHTHSHTHTVYICPASLPQGNPHIPRRVDHIHHASIYCMFPSLPVSHRALVLLGCHFADVWWLWWETVMRNIVSAAHEMSQQKFIPICRTRTIIPSCETKQPSVIFPNNRWVDWHQKHLYEEVTQLNTLTFMYEMSN